ncbi:hypothetical protein [Methanovulcanius yangii]|uniref:hypothetical protein n=1 Tax=Methanovulcanius yangii TaxID=1789227 RepID=UPI0029CA73FA|nr:hypothetical protein [Methanovulcanius yangii]
MDPLPAGPNPFVFSRPVSGSAFLGQTAEVEAASRAIMSGVPTIICGPPRSGTSSLALAACAACGPSVFPVVLSGAGITGPEGLALRLEEALRRAETGPGAALAAALEQMPSLCFSPWPGVSFTLSGDHRADMGDALSRVVRAAGRHHRAPVLLIDDAHRLLAVPGMAAVMGKIAAGEDGTGLILAGRRGMLLRRLGAEDSPGGGGGVMVSPAPLPEQSTADALCRRATEAGLAFPSGAAAEVVRAVRGHPFSVMRVAYALFEEARMGHPRGSGAGDAAVRRVVRELAPLYSGICDGLSIHQVGLLSAVAAGETHLYGREVSGRYGLQRTAVGSSLRALSSRDLIARDDEGSWRCTDPLLALWLSGSREEEGGLFP